MPRRGKLSTTKQYRNARTEKAMAYLREAGNLPAARKLARELTAPDPKVIAGLQEGSIICQENGALTENVTVQ